LKRQEELGSAFVLILKALKKTGYHVQFRVLNAADYGTPQTRERLVFIGSRDGREIRFPKPTHSRDPVDGQAPWVSLRDALKGLDDQNPVFAKLCPSKRKYLKRIPEGGNWRDLPTRSQKKALGGAYSSWGGRSGFFRRLAWDKPSPALTTKPDSKATMLCHPKELRPLSVRECACLQQFPDNWVFEGGVPQQYKQIGNAVPVGLGEILGRAIVRALSTKKYKGRRGKVICADPYLIQKICDRPKSILNPRRMRRLKSLEAARKWLATSTAGRRAILRHVDNCEDKKKGGPTNRNKNTSGHPDDAPRKGNMPRPTKLARARRQTSPRARRD